MLHVCELCGTVLIHDGCTLIVAEVFSFTILLQQFVHVLQFVGCLNLNFNNRKWNGWRDTI